MAGKKSPYLIGSGLVILALLILDQVTKHLARTHLRGAEDIILVPRVFQLHYLENRGAAFGLLQDQKFFFLVLCVLFLCASVWFLLRLPPSSRYIPLYGIAAGLAAGAAGNGIDRLFRGYVTDFLYFSFINFPVFNMADIYVVVSSIFLVIYVCFVYQEEDFTFMQMRKG